MRGQATSRPDFKGVIFDGHEIRRSPSARQVGDDQKGQPVKLGRKDVLNHLKGLYPGKDAQDILYSPVCVREMLHALELCGVLSVDGEAETEKKHDMKTILAGLKVIRKVLDYATESSTTRYKIMCWVQNSVMQLLEGKSVEEPPRR